MTAEHMPTAALIGSLTLGIGIPLLVGCLMWAVMWAAGRRA